MVKILSNNSRLQYKTQAEYFDEKNLAKPLIKSKNAELYDAFVFNYFLVIYKGIILIIMLKIQNKVH